MRASVYYKDTYFVLENVEEIGMVNLLHSETRRYKKYIFFKDKELGELIYPVQDIKKFYVYDK